MDLKAFSLHFLNGLKKLGFTTLGRRLESDATAQLRQAHRLRQIARRMALAREQTVDPLLQSKLEQVRNGI
jgi:hypothetical protein